MPNWNYVAIDANGKTRKGTVEAPDQAQAALKVRAEGLMVAEVKPEDIWSKEITIGGGGVKPRDLSVFCRQFVSMINAGVTITDALGMLSEQTENKVMAKSIRNVQIDIAKGDSLSESMSRYPKVFPDLLVSMVAAGESTGNIEISFERMATHFEKAARTRAMIKKAAVYPIIVAVVAVVVVIVMLAAVIPSYENMFRDLGTELPGITKMVVAASHGLQNYWDIILLIVVLAAVVILYYKKTDNGQIFFGKLIYNMPVFGKLTIKTASSMFARTLSTMVYVGIPMMEALDKVADTMSNALFRNAIKQARDEVTKGVPLSEPIQRCGLFPPMVHHMIKIGEETGDTESMLERLADYYDEEVEIATQTMMAALEPMIIIVLAVIVGTIIGAVLAPMLKMYEDLGNLI